MTILKYPSEHAITSALARPQKKNCEQLVIPVLKAVKENGDDALRKFTEKYDAVVLKNLQVTKKEISESGKRISQNLKNAIGIAKNNIEKFHLSQKEKIKKVETTKGVFCWRKPVPVEKVGLYIPGGSAPLFSTVLMLGIPARIAGCKEIILCSPPAQNGNIHPSILFCANLIGIEKIYKTGGAQAIAAMAYGTKTIPKVHKIFGPGNQYVTTAKMLVNKEGIAIDMPAGPSEVAVIADEFCVPAFVAADLLSQAEHGPDSQVVLISTSEKIIGEILFELQTQLEKIPRKKIAEQALKNSRAILVKNIDAAISISDIYAPEHLILAVKNADTLAEKVNNAGSVFIGNYSTEAVGDYAAGANHTLPTNGFAKAYSGVSLDSFVKKITFQKLTGQGLKNISSVVETMATAEGLDAHKNAVRIRSEIFKNLSYEKTNTAPTKSN